MFLTGMRAFMRSLVPSKPESTGWKKTIHHRSNDLLGYYKWLLLLAGFGFSFLFLQTQIAIGWNSSDSLDGRIYISKKGKIITPKYNARVKFTYHGRFLPPGLNFVSFRKKIVGLPGDEVQVDATRLVSIKRYNGTHQVIGVAKEFSMTGVPLIAITPGVIPVGYVAVAGDHKDSFDSRYEEIGLVGITELSDEALAWF